MKRFFSPSRDLAARRIREGGPRVYDPRERLFLALFDILLRCVTPITGLEPEKRNSTAPESLRRVLVLRLDRLGDLVMTLPALDELRKLVPNAEIELAVGSWNEDLARGLPFVDRVRRVDTPWAAWGKQASWSDAVRAMRRGERPDLVIDFQGDVRVILLMALTGAPLRAGFGDTGGSHLLTHLGHWNEKISWYRQSMNLVATLFPDRAFPKKIEPYNFLLPKDHESGREILRQTGLEASKRPWIGIHPSAGRAIKQWELNKFAALADRLVQSRSASVLLTGGPSDRDLVEQVATRASQNLYTMITTSGVRSFAAAVEQLDLFITGDTGPMHIAHAVGAPNLALFGPSDPIRYGPEGESKNRLVVQQPLYCSPCNMIRKPPRECARLEAPECLERISVDQVLEAALRLLGKTAGA